jgi:signal transduction histidine kinase
MPQCSLPDFLSVFPIFQSVPHEQIQFLLNHSNHLHIPADGFLFKKGEAADNMHMVFKGHLKIYTVQNNEQNEVAELEASNITGLLPFSRMVEATAYGQATEDTQVLSFHRKHFRELIREHYELTEVLVHEMNSRIRSFTTLQQQNDRMLSLGKLSAGLAHELNNPASAIARSSSELKKHLGYTPEAFKEVMKINLTTEQVDEINSIIYERLAAPKINLGLMARQEKEDELLDVLDSFGFGDADECIENLIEFGFEEADLQRIFYLAKEDHFRIILRWIDNNLTTEKTVSAIADAAKRIAELVSSVKSFTHMDQGQDRSLENIEDGLESTLRMLDHKLRSNKILVDKRYSPELPKLKIWAGQMNQVLTNLLDNAIDALAHTQNPQITIETSVKGSYARIYIRDNGPGIPDDIKGLIFDAFYTTKGVGKGTGMGLEISRRIIERHKGSLNVKSEPGNTEFELCLPIN